MVAHERILLSIQLHKSLNSCNIQGSYVPKLVKIGPYITSQSCPQKPDGRTDVYVILYYMLVASALCLLINIYIYIYSVQCICIALHWTIQNKVDDDRSHCIALVRTAHSLRC